MRRRMVRLAVFSAVLIGMSVPVRGASASESDQCTAEQWTWATQEALSFCGMFFSGPYNLEIECSQSQGTTTAVIACWQEFQ